MLDNAPYHRSKYLMANYERMKMPIMFLGPYHFGMAPIELMFSYIKQYDINFMRTAIQNK